MEVNINFKLEQKSYPWYKFRKDFITGSGLARLMGKTTFQSEVSNIIGRRLRDEPDPPGYMSEAMIQGEENEDIARMNYQLETGNEVIEAGFVWRDDLIGLSPDGLILKDEKIIGATEIICPDPGNHIHHKRMNIIEPKKRWQISYYFYVIPSLQWLDFISYDPRSTGHEMFIKRVHRKDVKTDLDIIHSRIEDARAIITKFETGSD